MINWLNKKICKEQYDLIDDLNNRIKTLNLEIIDLNFDKISLQKRLSESQTELSNAKKVINNIEKSYRPENMSGVDEIRMTLDIIDSQYMDIKVAMQPVSVVDIDQGIIDVIDKRKRIDLETRIGVGVLVPDDEDKVDVSHQTYCQIAREVGRRVEHDLLESSGWRVGI